MSEYPLVLSEEGTIEKMLTGEYRGMARFGDGDFNVIRGQEDRYHKACPKLSRTLSSVLVGPSEGVLNCLIPPPPMKEGTLAYQRWVTYLEVNAGILPFLTDEFYGSANISRMDSSPRLHTTFYWDLVAALWQDKDICLIRGSERSLTEKKLLESPGAPRSVREVICKPRDNFSQFDEILEQVMGTRRGTVVLCAGLTSRPLVHALVPRGLEAYDIGHLAMYFDKGQPIPLQDCPR